MLTVYGVYRSRATRILWLLGELGVPFAHVPVIQSYRLADPLAPDAPLNTKSPAFLAVNPMGKVPSIRDGDLVMHESLAITLYLAKTHGGALAAKNLAEDGLMTMWTLWAATEVEPHALAVLQHRAMKPPAERRPEVAAAGIAALKAPLAVLDEALARSGYVVGDRFTVADINVAECVRYASVAPEVFESVPRVKAWLAACQARPAFVEMWAKREAEPV